MSPPVADSTKQDEKKTSQRRINKPLTEKRRRARINDCLAQLKSIVLEAQDSQTPRPSKLEKADILEMTVEFIKKKTTTDTTNTSCQQETTQHKEYVSGYTGCLAEVSKFLGEIDDVNAELRDTIIKHMNEKIRDSNNNVNTDKNVKCNGRSESDKSAKEKIPIPCDPKQSVINNVNELNSSKLKLDSKSELQINTCNLKGQNNAGPSHSVVQDTVTTTPSGLVYGSQVLVVLQLPTGQNTLVSQPFSLPFFSFAQNSSNPANAVLQQESVPVAGEVGKPNIGVGTDKIISNQCLSDKRLENPSDILTSSSSDVATTDNEIIPQLQNDVQTLPLNLSTNGRQSVDESSKNHWRPW